jgi:hypothetical protein
MANSLELGRRIDAFVRELAEEFGDLPESDEPLITRIEDRAIEIGDLVMARIMERGLLSSASPDVRECCPACGRPGHCRGDRERRLQTRRGEVCLKETEYYCPGCRRSFFPGVQGVGD